MVRLVKGRELTRKGEWYIQRLIALANRGSYVARKHLRQFNLVVEYGGRRMEDLPKSMDLYKCPNGLEIKMSEVELFLS